MKTFTYFIAVLIVRLALPFGAGAQSVGLGGVSTDADNALLGRPLTGIGLGYRTTSGESPLSIRLRAEWLRGTAQRTGTTCLGPVPPGSCAPEQLDDRSRYSEAAVGVVFRLVSVGRLALGISTDLSFASVRTDTRGRTSGDELNATKRFWGGFAGAELRWSPVTRVPVALAAEYSFGILTPMSDVHIADGYTPYDKNMGARRLHLGLSWQFPRRD